MSTYAAVKSVKFLPSKTGLSTVGYQLYNADGTTKGSRITAGVHELSNDPGYYQASVTLDYGWNGNIQWDTGETTPVYCTEEINDWATIASAVAMILTSAYDPAKSAMPATQKVTLNASQTDYAPSKAGDAMTLTSLYDAAKSAASTSILSQALNALASHGDSYWATAQGFATATTLEALVTTVGIAGAGLTGIPALTADQIAVGLLDYAAAIDGKTLRQALRIIAAGAAGKIDDSGHLYGLDGTTVRATATKSGSTRNVTYP